MKQQFFLLTPRIDDPSAFRPKLDAAIATGAFSVIYARFAASTESDLKRMAMAYQTPVQDAGIAYIVDCPEDPRLIARMGLDGVHLHGLSKVADAIETLKPERIVGLGGVKTRHDAMEAGEMDIDYLMFGEPRPDDSVPTPEQTIERVQWWASIFNVPCVAYAANLETVGPLAATGAEFIALGPWIFDGENSAEIIAQARIIADAHAPEDPKRKKKK